MITRPLELAEKLRPLPRGLDALFYVNVGLLALFFTLFGSRFVLTPGFAMLPAVAHAGMGAEPTTHFITVLRTGQIYADPGLLSLVQLRDWLQAQAKTTGQPSLLIRASAGVSLAELAEIMSVARVAGFQVMLAAEEPAAK